MSTLQNESDQRAAERGADPADGVVEGAVNYGEDVVWSVLPPGWSRPAATARGGSTRSMQTLVSQGAIHWTRWDFPELRLSQEAALLIVQGLPLSSVFPADAYLKRDIDGSAQVAGGPFNLLRADYVPHESPPRLKNVVLAVVHVLPESAASQEVLGALVENVLGTSS